MKEGDSPVKEKEGDSPEWSEGRGQSALLKEGDSPELGDSPVCLALTARRRTSLQETCRKS